MYKRHGYISAKGVRHLLYVPNYTVNNHLHKYDMLYISCNEKIEPHESGNGLFHYKGYDDVLSGHLIVDFVRAAAKYSGYDVSGILKEIVSKREWYYERNPENLPVADTETNLILPESAALSVTEVKLAPDFGRRLPYRGQDYLLGGVGGRKAFFDNAFCVPVNYTSEQIRAACIRIYRELARRDLTAKVQEYAALMNVKPPELKINGAKTDLGSSTKSLNFSWRLVISSDDVIDYIVVYMLAHVIEPKRSSRFGEIIADILPDYKERQRRLRILQERLKADDWLFIKNTVAEIGEETEI